jgi:hypothetical protein
VEVTDLEASTLMAAWESESILTYHSCIPSVEFKNWQAFLNTCTSAWKTVAFELREKLLVSIFAFLWYRTKPEPVPDFLRLPSVYIVPSTGSLPYLYVHAFGVL